MPGAAAFLPLFPGAAGPAVGVPDRGEASAPWLFPRRNLKIPKKQSEATAPVGRVQGEKIAIKTLTANCSAVGPLGKLAAVNQSVNYRKKPLRACSF